jgi:hypothetical protein
MVEIYQVITPEFVKQLATEVKNSGGSWVNIKACPQCQVGYTVTPFDNGDVIAKFDRPVTDGKFTARRWKILPVSKRKPDGEMLALRK